VPIYEFVCRDCNTVYQFFSKRVDPQNTPPCPKHPGHSPLERMMSRFALGRAAGGGDSGRDQEPGGAMGGSGGEEPGDPHMEARMMDLMARMESIDETDGRAMGRMMRELAGITGEGVDDPAMQETIRRLESGEDPEKVEEIVSGAYGEDVFGGGSAAQTSSPSYDGGMYDM